MDVFSEISASEWDTSVQSSGFSGVLMQSSWTDSVACTLPFVSYRYYRYKDTHVLRLATVNGRTTSAPFGEGSDVVSLTPHTTPLDLKKFATDVTEMFDEGTRVRINERFTPVAEVEDSTAVATEDVVDLGEPLLPRVRKTLRHILDEPVSGEIAQNNDVTSINASYRLYVAHMRRVRNFAMPKELFYALLTEHGGELWTWSQGGKIGAMAIFMPCEDEVLYSLSAANAEAFAAHAPHHVVYTALEHYHKKGIERASLGSTGKGSGLEVFKRGWRGAQHNIYEIGNRSGVSRASKKRELVRFVPLAFYPLLTRGLGKYFF